MEKTRIKKRPYWLSKRLLAYLAAAVAAMAVFGVLLLQSATALVKQRKVERNCGYLLQMNADTYEANRERLNAGIDFAIATSEQELETFAVRLNLYETSDRMAEWDVLCRSYSSRFWLLDEDGRVLRGDALPESLGSEELQSLLKGNARLELGNMCYNSVPTTFGTLVSEIKSYSMNGDIFATSGNNNEDNGFTFWVSADGTLYGWPGGELDGNPLADYCTDTEALHTADGNPLTIAGATYYCLAKEMDDGSLLVAAVAGSELRAAVLSETELPMILFAAAALAVCLYALIMQEERPASGTAWKLHRGRIYGNRGLLAELVAVCVGGTVFLVGLSWLTMTLSSYAQHNQHAARYLHDIAETAPYYINENETEFSNFRATCTVSLLNMTEAVALQPELAEPASLGRYADAVSIQSVSFGGEPTELNCIDARLYDTDGTLLVTGKNFMTGNEEKLPSRALDNLKTDGKAMYYDDAKSAYCVAQRMDDGTGRYAMLLLGSASRYSNWLRDDGSALSELDSDKYQLAATAAGLDMGRDGKAFVISKEITANGKVVTALIAPMPDSYSVWIDETAMANFDVSNLREGYAGDQTIGGTSYYVNVASYQLPSQLNVVSDITYWVVYALPAGQVALDRLPLLVRVGVSGFVLLLLLAIFGSVRFSAPLAPAAASFTDRAERRTKTMNGHRVNGPIMGWGTKSGWGAKSAEEKFSTALGNLAVIVTLAMVLIGAAQGSFGNGSLIQYILAGDWDRELNVFSCTYVVLIFLGCFSVSWVVRGILGYVSGNLGPRSETMGRLFNSLIKYVTYLAAVTYLLYDFGVNANVLLASAGLLTLVLSPTLNMLLGDVSAGIFIVFEDEYRVGDVVCINGYRGIVLEITLRTTHLEDMMGNVKVFNNSKITEVENLSQEYTTAVIQVAVQYEDSLDHIENVLHDELPKLAKIVPNVVGTPTYEGVDEFGDSGVVLRIHVIVREELRVPMERRFRHELKMMLDRRGINVPYPQIVLHEVLAEGKTAEKPGAAEDAPSGPATSKEN